MAERRRRRRGQRGRPWYREQNDSWYIKQGGSQIRILDEDGEPVTGEENGPKAAGCWVRMQINARATERGNANPVRLVFSRYLDYIKREHHAVYLNYKRILVSFADGLNEKEFPVARLTAEHITRWFDAHPEWASTTKASSLSTVKAALNWGCRPENRLVDFNPIAKMKKPRTKSRGKDAVLEDGGDEEFLKHIPKDFAEILMVLRDTGTRPQNICRVTAADCDFERGVWVLDKHKTAEKTEEPLLVPLTPRVIELCRRLAAKYPNGPLFRGRRGNPMKTNGISRRFCYYKDKLRQQGIEVPKNFYAYVYRHTLLTELLEQGESEAIVAAIAGHKNTSMLHEHYSHLLARHKPMVEALARKAAKDRGQMGESQVAPESET